MSETHFTMPRLSSAGAAEERSLRRALSEATDLFARHKLFGLVWLDRDLIARNSYGALAAFVPLGHPVTTTVLPLMGLDLELRELLERPDQPFEMPNVALVDTDGSTPRLNLQVYWMPRSERFLLFISKVLATGELEIGLAEQVRARMMAEAELASQAQALAALNAELSRANGDLSEFAYIISHDLKAPLRAMRYFAEDLDRAVGGQDSSDLRALAEQIKIQSRRMAQMLTDLLVYSKIGRQEEALTTVDSEQLVRAIIDSIPRPSGFTVRIEGQWPTFETYPAPLDLVLRNLIANAISHHDHAEGVISVTGKVLTETLRIEVTDDGPGIAPEWHEAIFKPFRTIETNPVSDRSGIGLALVRRALETVGANLDLKSDPTIGRGTTFRLCWPIRH